MAVRTAEPPGQECDATRTPTAEPMPEGALFGQAALIPESLAPRQLLQLQRMIGNRATGRVATAQRQILQRSKKKEVMIPLAVRFDRPLTREEFIQLADEQLKLDPKRGTWNNLEDHYAPEDSPVRVRVAASLVKAQRSETTAAELGLEVDPSGTIAGAGERAAELATMSEAERGQLYDEIDRRYWATTGVPEGQKIKSVSGEAGNVAIWNQIRDEVLAQRSFIGALPEKAREVIRQSTDGVVIGPKDYEQIVRIANKVEQMDLADLENYLNSAVTTTDLAELEKAVDRFMSTKAAAAGKLEDLLELTEAGDWDVDTEAAALDADTLFYLSLEQRIKVIKEIAGGNAVGDEDERTIIRLLSSTPTGDVPGLLEALKADHSALLRKLESVIDGEENKLYYQAFRNLVFRSLDPATALQKMEGARVLPWSDPSLFRAYTNVRIYYETVEYDHDGNIRVVYWVNIGPFGMEQPEQVFAPDEIIALQFAFDEDFAGAVKGETIFMPAANLLTFKNEQFSRELGLVVDVGLLFAGGVGLIGKGTRLAKLVAALDLTVAAADLVIDSFRPEIAKTPEGKAFLRAWDTVNTLIAVYGAGRLIFGLPEVFRNLKKAWRAFRGKPGDLDPNDLRKIEEETDDIIKTADEALLEAEFAGLRGKHPEEVLKPFEPQIAKAKGIADAGKRKAAIEAIEEQVAAQQENVGLVAKLRKANPGMTNKEIADLAAPRIKVPKVPFGMDAEEFERVKAFIRKFLHDRGITDAEGFATGSRITGATFNPKKGSTWTTPFGETPPSFAKKDFDIRIIRPTPTPSSVTTKLKAEFRREFGYDLGVKTHTPSELAHIPIYGRLDLPLK